MLTLARHLHSYIVHKTLTTRGILPAVRQPVATAMLQVFVYFNSTKCFRASDARNLTANLDVGLEPVTRTATDYYRSKMPAIKIQSAGKVGISVSTYPGPYQYESSRLLAVACYDINGVISQYIRYKTVI